jgi:CBS domain-containing protein
MLGASLAQERAVPTRRPSTPRPEGSTARAARAAGARLLELRTVEVIAGRGRTVTLSSVRCPVHGRSRGADECAHCASGGEIARDALARGAYLSCAAPPAPRPPAGPAERAIVAEAMRRTSIALRPGVARSVAADALRARGVPAAPVVDGEGRPIGVVAEVDLLRARSGAKVSDAMARAVPSVPEVASIARAAALMAAQGTERLCVVSDDGVVVGVLTAADVVHWLAGPGGPLGAEAAGIG